MENILEFIYLQIFGMLFAIIGLFFLGALNHVNFVVVAFIWLLIIVEYTKPPIVRPRWHRKLRYAILLGVGIFVFVTIQRVDSLLAASP